LSLEQSCLSPPKLPAKARLLQHCCCHCWRLGAFERHVAAALDVEYQAQQALPRLLLQPAY
jgi:hypothetical protein